MRKVKIEDLFIKDETDVFIRCKNNNEHRCVSYCAAYFEDSYHTEKRFACCADLPAVEGILYNQAIGELLEGKYMEPNNEKD